MSHVPAGAGDARLLSAGPRTSRSSGRTDPASIGTSYRPFMDSIVLGISALTAATAGIHLFAGGRGSARPLLDGSREPVVDQTLYAVWHMASVDLVLSALLLAACGAGMLPDGWREPVLITTGGRFLLYAGVFAWRAIVVPGGFRLLPQWTLLGPIGIAALVAGMF